MFSCNISTHPVAAGYSIRIQNDWDGLPRPQSEHTHIRITGHRLLRIDLDAPFYRDPSPKAPVGRTDGLWAHEVVELFFADAEGAYTELEVGPYGHHLLLRFSAYRVPVEGFFEPEEVKTRIEGERWSATLFLSEHVLPKDWCLWNAYTLSGPPSARRYGSAFPGLGTPDFHRVEFFGRYAGGPTPPVAK